MYANKPMKGRNLMLEKLDVLGLSDDEVRFYDALATNESAVKYPTDLQDAAVELVL